MVPPNGREGDREYLRRRIAHNWNRNGRKCWTAAEMEAAIDAELRRRQNTPPQAHPKPNDAAEDRPNPPEPRPVQQVLFGANETTRRTRATAALAASAAGPGRCETVTRFVASRRETGATRDEIAAALSLPIQSVCPLVKSMERAGKLVPTARTRLTRSGKPAAVVVVPEHARGEGGPKQ